MKKTLAVLYGYLGYLTALGTILYTIGFVGDILVPKSITSGQRGTVWGSVLVDLTLLLVFFLQHSGMARSGFKSWISDVLPRPFQRTTYVLAASFSLAALMIFWQPLPDVVWHVEPAWARISLWILYGLGWGMVFVSARLINSGHFFGVQQMKDFSLNRPQTSPEFQTPGLYQYVRHPLMLGFLIAFWAAPHMSLGRLLFSSVITLYILIAVQLEERDLIRKFGDRYRRYRDKVPGLIPRFVSSRAGQGGYESEKMSERRS
jgi:protein-S-isoprenylcysteine O-methyltransferase Ste14